MKLFDDLKRLVDLLAPYNGSWAICGGVAASIYRDTPRYTGDIDIAIIDSRDTSAMAIAEQITIKMNFKPIAGWVTDQHGSVFPGQALVIGRADQSGKYLGIDFLLPVLGWVHDAVVRAQVNNLDFGFAKLPTITIEDMIIAKLFAYQGAPERGNDLDDLKSIQRTHPAVDLQYLHAKLKQYGLEMPPEFHW